MADKTAPLDTPVQFVKGVGPRKAALFERMGIHTVNDLLLTLPRRYENRSEAQPIRALSPNEFATVKGKVRVADWVTPRFGKGYFEAVVEDTTGLLFCRWFGATYLIDALRPGMKITAFGKVTSSRSKWVMMHPEYEKEDSVKNSSIHLNRIVPVYTLTDQLPQRSMRRVLWEAVNKYTDLIPDLLTEDIRSRHSLMPLPQALREVHFPSNLKRADQARRRLVFEEFLLLQLLVARHKKLISQQKGTSLKGSGKRKSDFIASLPFKLTSAQQKALQEIENDMSKTSPMNRLLQGDVGSGKTVVAACAVLDAIEAGTQATIMVPTEVLASQHFQLFSRYLVKLNIECALITSDLSASDRRNALAGLKSGRIRLVVGTHAIIYDHVVFKKLGLAIIDEQHKFGVQQRASLHQKGVCPHMLVMTATPIPRTLAMTLYGDLDISVIDEMPEGRQKIVTRVIDEDKLPLAYGFIKEQIAKGRQAYFIYPLVEESEKLDLKAAETMFKNLKKTVFTTERMGLIHGRLSSPEKQHVMQQFKEQKIDILVSTTVVEVGVDVANANVILVGNAERFGLAQLHQLRGRVGRGRHKSFCVLQGVAKSLDAWRRLKIMEETNNGFRIAEEDLRIRGMGNILGKEQSGFPILKVGHPMADIDILVEAREEAFRIVERYPENREPGYQQLWLRADELAEQVGSLGRVG